MSDEWNDEPVVAQSQTYGNSGNSRNNDYQKRNDDRNNRQSNNYSRNERGGGNYGQDRNNYNQKEGGQERSYQPRNNQRDTNDQYSQRSSGYQPRNDNRDNNDQDRQRSGGYQPRNNDQDRQRSSGYSNQDGGGGSQPKRHQPLGNCTDSLEVDPDSIKFIIGRGGSKINEIQSSCDCSVKIDRNEINENGMSTVKIFASNNEDVEKAKNIILEITGGSGGNRNSNTGGSGGGGYNNSQLKYGHSNGKDENEIEPKRTIIDWDVVNAVHDQNQHLRWEHLPKLIKDFYEEDPEVTNMTADEIEFIRKSNNDISVKRVFAEKAKSSDPIPNPVKTFEHCFKKYPDLLEELKKQKFVKPSPIQCQAWPVLLKGEDLIGIAQTGTGKTLAFLVPAFIHTEFQPTPRAERTGPNVLVLAPTRELALQIQQEVGKYSFRGMRAVCIYGGGDRKEQIKSVEKGVEIIIATPGRLNDLVEAKVIDVSSITYLVLDEADRMLDMGFEPQIRKTLLDIRPDRQTIMTSATWPPGVRRLAESYMNNPIQVFVGSLNLAAVHSVTQNIEILTEDDKYPRIMEIFSSFLPSDKAIIFCGRKTKCDDLASEFTLKGINVQCIHGDREQADREQALHDIKVGEVQVLIATDVASRGIDIDDISHVINYDFPRNIEEYVHRVGRTGRAGKYGTAISFFTREDWAYAGELIPILREADQVVPEEIIEMAERFEKMKERRAAEGGGRGGYSRGGGRGGGGRGGGGFGGGGFGGGGRSRY